MQVCLWSSDADVPQYCPSGGPAWLSAAERARAAAFRFARDQHRFTIARGFLRYVLGQHLAIEPAAVELQEVLGMKPTVAAHAVDEGLFFSLSRSTGRVVVAVAQGRELGVDVECVRPSIDVASLAPSAFSARALADWNRLDRAQQHAAFYRAWSRKEAFGKAEGHGLSIGPETIEVPLMSFAPGSCHRIGVPESAARWIMSDLPAQPGAFGCLVVERFAGEALPDCYADQCVEHELPCTGTWPRLRVPDCARLMVRTFASQASVSG